MEKYGTIPPQFSVAWWEHYLYYYKFHIAVVAFLIFMFGSIIYSNVTRTHYDLHISYIGFGDFGEEGEGLLSAYVEPVIDEITGNDKKEVEYIFYSFDNVMEDDMVSEAEYAYQMKLVAELQGGDSDLYIMTGSNAEELAGFGENFVDISELVGEGYPEEKVIRNEQGHPFAVSLADNEELKELGINPAELYVCVRELYAGHKDNESRVKTHENSIKAAKLLIGE